MKKRFFAFLMALCLVASLLPAQTVTAENTDIPEEPPVWSITANSDIVEAGSSLMMYATGEEIPQDLNWTVSDENIATINGNNHEATLEAVSAGTVTVTARSASEDASASMDITVVSASSAPSGPVVLGDLNDLGTASAVSAVFTPNEDGDYVFFAEIQRDDWSIVFDGGIPTTKHQFLGGYGWIVEGLNHNTDYAMQIYNDLGINLELRIMMLSPDAPDLSFPEDTIPDAAVGNEWSFPVLPVAPDGVLGNISWEVDNEDVVRMTPDGKFVQLNFIAAGTVTLKATDTDSGKYVEHTVTVTDSNQGGGGTPSPAPVGISVGETKVMTFDEENFVDSYVFEFTPTETANYVMYYQYANNRPALGMDVYDLQDDSAVTVDNADTWLSGEDYLHSYRFDLVAGQTYHLVFGWNGNGTVEYTLQKACAPTAMEFPVERYSNFVGSGDGLDIKMTPVYASGEVTYTVADPSIVTVNNWGGMEYLAPGETTLTATCGDISITVDVESRAPVEMLLDEPSVTNTNTGCRVRYSFTPVNDGDYSIEIGADVKLWIGIWDKEDDTRFWEHWTVEAGDTVEHWTSLEGGRTYTLDVSMDYTDVDVHALVRELTEEDDGFQIPEDVTPGVLKLNKKVDIAGGTEHYFTFTAPAEGFYNFCIGGSDMGIILMTDVGEWWFSGDMGKVAIRLDKDQQLQICCLPDGDMKLWVEKSLVITDLELLEQDTTKVFQKSNDPAFIDLLGGLTLKATFADGSTKTVTLPDNTTWWNIEGYEPIVSYDFENATGNTAPVTLRYGDEEVTFYVKLTNKVVTDLEIVADSPIQIVENMIGWENENENGPFFEYDIWALMLSQASYRFTWSDGTTETVTFDSDSDAIYFGKELWYSLETEQYDEPWVAGQTYTVYITYGELRAPMQFEIVEFPAKKLEIVANPTALLGEPNFYKVDNGAWELDVPALNDLIFKITYKDNSTKTFKFAEIQWINWEPYADGMRIALGAEDEVFDGYFRGACDVSMMLFVGDLSAEFTLHVVEKVVENNQTTVAPSVVEEELAKADQNATEIVIDASSHTADETDNTKSDAAKLPVASLEKVADASLGMTVKMDNAQVTFDAAAMDAIVKQAGETTETQITLTVKETSVENLTEKQQKRIEKALKKSAQAVVLDLTLVAGEQVISDFSGGEITVRIPFTPPAGTKGEDYTVFYISPDGKKVEKMKTTYVNGELVFTTTHFSDYVALTVAPESEDDTTSGNSAQSGKTPAPNTGDEANIFGLTAMMVLSGMLAAAFLALRKRSRV